MRVAHPLMAVLLCVLALGGQLARAESPSYETLPDDRVLYVAPGQSLALLVQRIYPDRARQWADIRAWIVEHNPHAFVDGDPERMRADVRVKLPTPSAIAASDPYRPNAAAHAAALADAGAAGLRFGQRHVFVDPAQALSELVPRLYPEEQVRWDQIIEAIVTRNAERLSDLDANREIARGTRLQIPTVAPGDESARAGTPGPEGPPPEVVVARVIAHQGELNAVGRSGEERELDTGDVVRRGDVVRTGNGASAEIRFEDQETLFLRADTHLRVHEWRLPETGPGSRVIELFRGGLRAITGAIGNRADDTYRTITPQATLGVRGTEYALRVCAQDDCHLPEQQDGVLPGGLYVGVDSGRVVLLNEAAETVVSAGEYRYVAGPGVRPESTDAGIVAVLYTEAERAERAPISAADEPRAGAEEDDTSWWWGILGAILIGVAL